MERRVRGNSHARCGVGENPETLETVGLPITIKEVQHVAYNVFEVLQRQRNDRRIR